MRLQVTNAKGAVFDVTFDTSENLVVIHDHTTGQKVADYYIETFLNIPDGKGLNMCGGDPRWTLAPTAVQEVKRALP